jgi:N-acetylglucosamine kinase-like BadF-type ATPase
VVGLHDSQLAHAAILQGEDGIITIAGTGSVSFGCYKGKTARTGGWGHILGDEGSGYWIALEALKRITVEHDTEMDVSLLSQSIFDQLGVHDADGIKEFVHRANKQSIAGIAPIVTSLAKDGERNATSIVNRAGSELAMMTVRLYKRLGMTSGVTIGVSGSILCKIDLVREQFERCLDRDLDQVRILIKDISPTKGACFLYRNKQ